MLTLLGVFVVLALAVAIRCLERIAKAVENISARYEKADDERRTEAFRADVQKTMDKLADELGEEHVEVTTHGSGSVSVPKFTNDPQK